MKDFDFNADYRKHVWTVQSRDTQAQIDEYKDAGIDAGENEWVDRLSKPVSGPRAIFLANDMENEMCVTRIVKLEESA